MISSGFQTLFPQNHFIRAGEKLISLKRPLVAGILNLTSDSFLDGGKYNQEKEALKHCEKLLNEGADIIDVGAQSTRPGAFQKSVESELSELMPIFEKLVQHFPDAIFSIDTYRASVAEAALNAGAHIINDISGGDFDAEMFPLIIQKNVPYILMHTQGRPENMQENPHYKDVCNEVFDSLLRKAAYLQSKGVKDLLLDPGFGFGKTVEHNYLLLKNLDYLVKFGFPVYVGISGKSMINKVLGIKAADSLNGTSVLNTMALMKGAKILRVHHVKEAKECILLAEQIAEQNM